MFILQQKINGNKKNAKMKQSKVSVKYSEENLVFGKSLISAYSIFGRVGRRKGVGDMRLFEFEREGGRWGGD